MRANLATIDLRLDQQIPCCLTIFCGGVRTVHTARKIARYHGVDENEIGVFRWRGNGWPGPTRVKRKDGRAHDMSYDATWFDESVPWTYDLQFRCKICLDEIGELGDVAYPDGCSRTPTNISPSEVWGVDNSTRPIRESQIFVSEQVCT